MKWAAIIGGVIVLAVGAFLGYAAFAKVPASAPPAASFRDPINFSETGHLVQGNPGMKPAVWYLVYEKPGKPALTKELAFRMTNTPTTLTQGERVHVEGRLVGTTTVSVQTIVPQ